MSSRRRPKRTGRSKRPAPAERAGTTAPPRSKRAGTGPGAAAPSPHRRRVRPATFAGAAVILGCAVVPIALLTTQDEQAPGLRVESYARGPAAPVEIVVSVEDAELNRPATASGAAAVRLECRDASGRVVVRARHHWPFPTDDTSPLPHVHQRVSSDQLEAVTRCRLAGTDPPLEGTMSRSGI